MIKWNDAWTGPDKNKHIVGCALIGASVTALSGDWQFGIVIASSIAFFKELIWDLILDKGTPSPQDLIVSVAGAVVGSAVVAQFL